MLTDAPIGSRTDNLPRRLTPLMGRATELVQIKEQLLDPACRLLTLLGAGGMGKTRLALEVAATVADEFAAGVCFVNLQPVSTPAQLPTAIADAIGVSLLGADPVENQLYRYLAHQELLLLLDNFEHLLPASEFLVDLLGQSAGLKLLVTSREVLNLQEEWLFPLAGLHFPPVGFDPQNVEQYSATQLFTERARRLRPNFGLANEAASIGRICQLVEGMPLGLELAATWTKTLTCTEIAAEIERGIDFLASNLRNTPERHRTMVTVIEQSWQRLTAQEQAVFVRLSIFHGGFERTAAEQVAGATLAILSALVDKSLLRWEHAREPSGLGRGRYQIHELLRQYAAEKLAATVDQAMATRQQHSHYYLTFLHARAHDLNSAAQRRALDEISLELDNVRAGWEWAVAQGDLAKIGQSIDALYDFYQIRGRYREGEAICAHVLHHLAINPPNADPITLALVQQQLTVRLGAFRLQQGDLAGANAHFEKVRNRISDPNELALVYTLLGTAARLLGNREAAAAFLEQGLAYARIGDDPIQLAETLLGLAEVTASSGDYHEGQRWAQEALVICHSHQIPDLTARVLAALAWATNCLGHYAESEAYYRESLAIFEAINHPFGIALTVQFLGWVAFCAGEARLPDALAHYQRAIAIFRQIGHRTHLAMAFGDFAIAATEFGDHAAAFRHAQEGLAITKALNHRNLMAYNLYALGAAACGLGDLVASRHYLLHSLQISRSAQLFDHVMCAFYYFAQLLYQESLLSVLPILERQPKRALAVELLTLVIRHPTTWQLFRERAQRLLSALNTREAADCRPVEELMAELLAGADWSGTPPQVAMPSPTAPANKTTAQGNASLIEPLTERELEILHLIAEGHTNQAIADQLILSTGTVKWYSSEIYGKLGVASRTQAVAEARRLKLLEV